MLLLQITTLHPFQHILTVLLCILLLILLITWGKCNPFLAFLIVSILAAWWLGIPLNKINQSVQKGIGDTLGSLTIIIMLGAMLGKLVVESGAAQKITSVLMKAFGEKYIQWALMITGFVAGIPLFYNVGFVLMVPLIFAPYADDMAARVAALAPRAVLETAAGSGVVTRALAPRLVADARYVVTDLNPPMLEHAAIRQGDDARIEWRPADALQLPFEDAAFDVVCCQFGAMFFPDRAAGYAEARRVLRPGGHFVFSVWDRIEENRFADDVTQALATVFPDDPPRFLVRTPHGYHDAAQIRDDLRRAGFADADIDLQTHAHTSRAVSARAAAAAYCQGTPLRGEIEARDATRMPLAIERATDAIARGTGDGPAAGKIQAHLIVARR